jgi:hypothetical protein
LYQNVHSTIQVYVWYSRIEDTFFLPTLSPALFSGFDQLLLKVPIQKKKKSYRGSLPDDHVQKWTIYQSLNSNPCRFLFLS